MKKTAAFVLAILASLAFLVNPGFGALPRYEITDLGTLGGGYSCAYAINEAGQVVGISATAGHVDHAFLWDRTHGMIDLGGVPGGRVGAEAYGINDHGQVVGYANSDDGCAFIWDSTNGMRYLDGIGDSESAAYAINNAGQVIGFASISPSWGFLWESGIGLIVLPTLGGSYSAGKSINNVGQVVGYSPTGYGYNTRHAFLWDSTSSIRDLGTLGGRYSEARGINDTGQVVGYSEDIVGDERAFLWDTDTGMIDLGRGYPDAINNAAQVVGSLSAGGPAFYWDTELGMIPLSDLLPPNSGWQRLSFANDINNHGQIVGLGITDRGEYHAFLMTPVPEPAIEAGIDVYPDTLNLTSKGKWITCYICFSEDYDVVDIDPNSIVLEDEIQAQSLWLDEEEQVAIAKLKRSDVQGILEVGEVELTVTGQLLDGTVFEGTDVIRVIDKGGRKSTK